MNVSERIYQLTVGDIQDVAVQSIERQLSDDELREIVLMVEDRMPWFEVIQNAIWNRMPADS